VAGKVRDVLNLRTRSNTLPEEQVDCETIQKDADDKSPAAPVVESRVVVASAHRNCRTGKFDASLFVREPADTWPKPHTTRASIDIDLHIRNVDQSGTCSIWYSNGALASVFARTPDFSPANLYVQVEEVPVRSKPRTPG
jgi:hypothetical protein